jgi:hypothetical protein
MTEGNQPAGEANVFEAIDPKLNMFALANGMDLLKSDESRRLVWFMGGLERGLEITSGSPDGFSIDASAWPTRSPDELKTAPVSEGVAGSDVTGTLEQGIEVANSI